MIHQTDHIVAHRLAAVRRRIVRLAALAVTAAIERDDAIVRRERVEPTAAPVMLRARRKPMHQHDRFALPVFLEINLHAIGIEISHRSTLLLVLQP